MIAIINVDPNPRKNGLHLYEIRINRTHICYFTHHREDDLAELFEKAYKATRGIGKIKEK